MLILLLDRWQLFPICFFSMPSFHIKKPQNLGLLFILEQALLKILTTGLSSFSILSKVVIAILQLLKAKMLRKNNSNAIWCYF